MQSDFSLDKTEQPDCLFKKGVLQISTFSDISLISGIILMFFSTSSDTNPIPEPETTPENHVTRKNVTGIFPNIFNVKDNHIP